VNDEKHKTVILALCRKLISNLIKETIEKRPGMEVIAGDGYKYADVIAETHKPNIALVEMPERDGTPDPDILKICGEIKAGSPGCMVILICPEKDSDRVNECVEAKKRGYIDEFLFFDATSDYLISKIEALIVGPENKAWLAADENNGAEQPEESLIISKEPPTKKKRRPLKYKAACLSAAVCLIIVCGVLIVTDIVNRTPGFPNMSGDSGGLIDIDDQPVPLAAPLFPDENALPYEGGEETTGGPGYLVPGYDGMNVPVTNGRQAQVTLFNHESNPCSLIFEFVLEETGETLYKSGLVDPGMCVKDAELDETQSIGEHKAVLIISAYGLENFEKMEFASIKLTLSVE